MTGNKPLCECSGCFQLRMAAFLTLSSTLSTKDTVQSAVRGLGVVSRTVAERANVMTRNDKNTAWDIIEAADAVLKDHGYMVRHSHELDRRVK